MASTRELEETLPLIDPDCARYPDALGKKYAVYSMIALSHEQRSQLEKDLNTAEDSTGNCHLAPQADFAGQSLRDIYDYHIRVRDEDETIHPLYFIVTDRDDWHNKGVLMVYLTVGTDRPDPFNAIGVGRCGVDIADLIGADLDIGNVDWIDCKEEEEHQWGGDDSYQNKRYFETEPKPSIPESLQHYAWYSLVKKAGPIPKILEQNWSYMRPGESRLQQVGSYYHLEDPWPKIRREHPWQVLSRGNIHPQLFLVAEKEDADSPGCIAICQAQRDGDLSGFLYDPDSHEGRTRDRKAILAIQPEVKMVKKVRACEALEELDYLAVRLAEQK